MSECGSESKKVTILVPALNEEATIQEVVNRLLDLPIESEIIVINDGSTDNTGKILQEFGNKITVITKSNPGGKGAAIRSGLTAATGKAIIIQDADLEYAPEQIPALVEPILQDNAKVVYGSRFTKGLHPNMALPNKMVNILLRLAVLILFGRKITDEATCYKAFHRETLLSMDLVCHRFEFCPEVTAKAIILGESIVELPIDYEPRSKAAGKKIRWTDAPEAFWTLLRHRFWKKPT